MAKQTFTTGQVLSAAQVNALQANDYNTTVSTNTASYVLVAADVGTTIVQNVATNNTVTVNTGLFAPGDTLRIQNIGVGIALVSAGTATVNTANSLALPQWGSGILYFTSASAAIFFPSAGAAAAAGGKVKQIVNVQTEAISTGNTNLPDDTSIPQITEGTQFLSLAITPTSATSKLLIQIIIFGGISTLNRPLTVALFEGTTSDALAASSAFGVTGNKQLMVPLNHTLTAGVTTELTFRVRVGTTNGDTVSINGISGERYFGAIPKSSMTITEYTP